MISESTVRELIADVVEIKALVGEHVPEARVEILKLERKLGGMLPRITGKLHINLSEATLNKKD
jgi:hypothetical protein